MHVKKGIFFNFEKNNDFYAKHYGTVYIKRTG